MKKILSSLPWAVLFLSLSVSSAYLAWVSLAKLNFLYPLAYELIEIDKTITRFAPLSRYKKNFELTNRDEHIRIFEKIVAGILDRGTGLSSIYYRHADGRAIDTLLTSAEITHLNDVANLVSLVDDIGVFAIVVTLLLASVFSWKKPKFPTVYKYHVAGVLIILVIILLIFAIGAETVFYAAHVWVFPDDHQWYFYYDESLMTMLMKAPVLFAVIAVELLVLSCVYYSLGLFSLRRAIGYSR
jgi:hypothetical protein